MLIRIRSDQARLGMYVESFDGAWLDHPFWRSGFLLESERDVARVRDSGVAGVVIDDMRGVGVEEEADDEPARQADPVQDVSDRGKAQGPGRIGNRRRDPDIAEASQLVMRSKRAVKRMFGDIRLGKAVDAAKLTSLVDEITTSVVRHPQALVSIARLKSKDEYTYLHSVAVCALMINLARHLKLDETLVRDIGMAGLLHDVGKMAVPEALLQKPGALTDAEFAVVRDHAERGYKLLKRSAGVPEIALDVCRHHHERFDGSGYPHGLKGEAISLYARMGAICDVYDAVTSARAYKDAWNPAEALSRMAAWQGHFDPAILPVFMQSIGIYPVGTLVRLRSDELAVVVGDCPDDFTRPLVTTFYRVSDRRRTIEQTRRIGTLADRIVAPENPADWGIDEWEALCERLLTAHAAATHRAA